MASPETYLAVADAIIRNAATGSTLGSWQTLVAAATGTVVDAATATQVMVQADNGSYADGKQYCDRQALFFDTSSLPDEAAILSAYIGVYLTTIVSTAGGSVGVTASTISSNSSFATSDFGSVGATELATRVNFSSLTLNQYNQWDLNAAGLAAINKTGFTKLCLRSSFDIDATLPTSGQRVEIDGRNSEFSGTGSDPYLVVVWTVGSRRPAQVSASAVIRASTR